MKTSKTFTFPLNLNPFQETPPKNKEALPSIRELLAPTPAPNINQHPYNTQIQTKVKTYDLGEIQFCKFKNCSKQNTNTKISKKRPLIKHYLDIHPQPGMVKYTPGVGFLKFDGVTWQPTKETKATTLQEIEQLVEQSAAQCASTPEKAPKNSRKKRYDIKPYHPPLPHPKK